MELKKNRNGEVFVELGGGVRSNPNASHIIDIEENSNADIICNIAEGIPFPDNSVDQFYARAVLEHLSHDQNRVVFSEIARTLKPGGKFWFRVPHFFSPVSADDPTHRSFWTLKTVEYFVGKRLAHVFTGQMLHIAQNHVVVEFPSPLSFIFWPRFRMLLRGGSRLEQFAKLPFVISNLEVTLIKSV